MAADLAIFSLCLVVLGFAADVFVQSAAFLAGRFRVSSMVIGITVVGIGTSLPELMSSAVASFEGHSEIALGNVVGSNICNIGLILGLPALIAPLYCHREVVLREGLLMLAITAILFGSSTLCEGVPRPVGAVFLVGFALFLRWTIRNGQRLSQLEPVSGARKDESAGAKGAEGSVRFWMLLLRTAAALFALVLSSDLLVDSTVSLAHAFAVSTRVIALSLIAFGTSVPELSVSLAAARRGEGDILVGNILGSNICNILLVLGASSLIRPISFGAESLIIDFSALILFSVLMMVFLYARSGITRLRGGLLLLLYAGFIWRCVAMA